MNRKVSFLTNKKINVLYAKFPIWRAKSMKFNKCKIKFFLMRCPKVMHAVMEKMNFTYMAFQLESITVKGA